MKGAEIILSFALPSDRPLLQIPFSWPPSLAPPSTQPGAVNLGAAPGREGLMKPSSLRPPGSDSSYLQSKELGKEVIRL